MTRRLLLLAHPAGHSLSPAMHEAACAALGIDASYRAVDVPPEGLERAVAELRDPEVAGANVTVPHKRAVIPWLDGLTEAARRVGAVNTIVPTAAGLIGDNTDAHGFLRGLAELGVDPSGRRCVVLGAGGAARAVTVALLGAGAQVALSNRTEARARELAADLEGIGQVAVLAPGALEAAVRGAHLLVQATSAGMRGVAEGVSPLPPGVVPDDGAVVDLVYRPAQTPLLEAARRAGLAVQNGLPMLVHQGALAFERWFGRPAPVEVMRRAALAALSAD